MTVLSAGSSADVVFALTPDFPSIGFTYPLGAHFTSGYVGSDSLPITVVGSMDPNDKTGPGGVGGARYLKGDSMLAYNIVFENDPVLAIAPAQQVVILDQLDPTAVDLNTFLFGPITFGRGVEITVTCDDTAFEGIGSFLLGLVLQEFFAKYVSINSFTSTVLRSSERGEVMRWSPNLGRVQTL